MFNKLLLICATFPLVALTNQNSPELKIDQGVLKGRYRTTVKGKIFRSFSGIPYAEPPIEELRFKAPVPAKPWEGVLDATNSHAVCPQMNVYLDDYTIRGEEDCLYLNVYSPKMTNPNNQQLLLPVMFYIHGGGWMCGDANSQLYGPDILLDKGVVLVTANYRLGVLGFLSTGDNVVPGNNGLKDQNLAIKWVKKNIMHFGGDPESITIFGQSAGGASAHFHVLSPLSKGLINGAIIQSGTAVAPWALALKPLASSNTNKLATFLNCPNNSSKALVDCLRKIKAYDIVKQDPKFIEYSYDPMIPFKPVVEDPADGAFITEDPFEIIKSNKAAQIPVMTGFTTEDAAFKSGVLYKYDTLIEQLNDNFKGIAPLLLVYHETKSNQDKISKNVRKWYFGDRNIDKSTKSELTDLLTDAWFHLPVDELVRKHTKYTNQKVYYYIFGYRGSKTYTTIFKSVKDSYDYGVCHGDELQYLFRQEFLGKSEATEKDTTMIDIMSTLWTNFAKTGNPTPTIDNTISTIWNPVTSNNLEYYLIKSDDDIRMKNNFRPERIQFWRNIPFNSRWEKVKDEF